MEVVALEVGGKLRTAQRRSCLMLFAALGLQVGAWTILLADLAAGAALVPAELGIGLTVMSLSGIAVLPVVGRVLDRHDRRISVGLAVAGVGVFTAVLPFAAGTPLWWPVLAAGGVATSFYDVAMNTVASDYEHRYATQLMTRFHAAFSAAAALGAVSVGFALTVGAPYRSLYLAFGAVLLATAGTVVLHGLPPSNSPEQIAVDTAGRSGLLMLLRNRGVLVAAVLVFVCFYGDAALEGFSSLYLRDLLSSGPALAGLAVGGMHVATMLGRLVSARQISRRGERSTLTLAGIVAAAGLGLSLLAPVPALAVVGFVLIGLAVAPVAPVAFAVAGRSAPGRTGRAASLVTAAGYVSFIVAPAVVGALAQVWDLRTALAPLVLAYLLVSLVSTRLPAAASHR